MPKYRYEIAHNKTLSFGSIEARNKLEALERFQNEIKAGTLLHLETEKGIVLYEKIDQDSSCGGK